jgi:hypothetical protein
MACQTHRTDTTKYRPMDSPCVLIIHTYLYPYSGRIYSRFSFKFVLPFKTTTVDISLNLAVNRLPIRFHTNSYIVTSPSWRAAAPHMKGELKAGTEMDKLIFLLRPKSYLRNQLSVCTFVRRLNIPKAKNAVAKRLLGSARWPKATREVWGA